MIDYSCSAVSTLQQKTQWSPWEPVQEQQPLTMSVITRGRVFSEAEGYCRRAVSKVLFLIYTIPVIFHDICLKSVFILSSHITNHLLINSVTLSGQWLGTTKNYKGSEC